MKKRLYYFTSEKYGLENLRQQRLKISDFSNLNDPFELLGIELRDRDVRKAVGFEKSKVSKTQGLVCFSEDRYNPVQWAHYTDNHKGVCLGFDVLSSDLRKVTYVSERLARSTLDEPNANEKLLTTKFRHWEYEQERRLIVDLKSFPPNGKGLRFVALGTKLDLKEVYLGCYSSIEFDDVKKSFRSTEGDVVVRHTRPSFRDFRIVWDQSRKSIRI
jgi:hypothetical protein